MIPALQNCANTVVESRPLSTAASYAVGVVIYVAMGTPAGFLGGVAFYLGTEMMRHYAVAENVINENVQLRFKIQSMEKESEKLINDNDELLTSLCEERTKRQKTIDHLILVASLVNKK